MYKPYAMYITETRGHTQIDSYTINLLSTALFHTDKIGVRVQLNLVMILSAFLSKILVIDTP